MYASFDSNLTPLWGNVPARQKLQVELETWKSLAILPAQPKAQG